MDGPNSASHALFVDTNLETHLALLVSDVDSVSDVKKKVVHEHLLCFPEIGDIRVEAMKVKRKGCFYHLSDTMGIKSAFDGVKGNWFLSAGCSRISKCNLKDHPSDPVSSYSLLAQEKSSLRCDGPSKLSISDAPSSEQVEKSQFVGQNGLNPVPICPDSAKNILNAMEMEVEHYNQCKTSSSERSEQGMPEESKQTGEGMIMLGEFAESMEVSAANLVNVMHPGENMDGDNRTQCGARKKQKVGGTNQNELLGHTLNFIDTSVDNVTKNTTEAAVDAVHASPIDKSEEAPNNPNKQSNDEPERSSHVTTTQRMDAVKIDQLNDMETTLRCDKVSAEVSKSGSVKKNRKAQRLSGSGGLLMETEAVVSNCVDDSCIMPTSDNTFSARNVVNGRKKKRTKSACLQEEPTDFSSLRDARGDSSKGVLGIENKVPDEEPEVETFLQTVKTNSEPQAVSSGEMGSHHRDQETGEGNEQHDPGNTEKKDDASKLLGAKDNQMTMTNVPGKHNLSETDKILLGTTEVAGSSKVDASGLSVPCKSGKKSKSKKTPKSARDKQAASGFGHEDQLVDDNASIENHEISTSQPSAIKSTDQGCQTEVGGELLQKSSPAVDLPQECRATEGGNIVVNTTEVNASSTMNMDTNESHELQKSDKKQKSRKAAKSGGKTNAKPDSGHGDGVFSAIASFENHGDSKNDSLHKSLDQPEDRRKLLHKYISELVSLEKLKASDPDATDVNATVVASSSKLDAVVESQKPSKRAKSKKTTKAGGENNESKDNKPMDQTEKENEVLQKIYPDLVPPEHEANVPEKNDAGTMEVGGYSNLDANEVQESNLDAIVESQKPSKRAKSKKTTKAGGENNESKDNKTIDQTEKENEVLQKSYPDLVPPEHEANVPEKNDAGTMEVGGYSNLDANEVQESKLDAVVESQKPSKRAKSKKTTKAGGENKESKDNKPIDQTEKQNEVLLISYPDLVPPEHEANVPEKIDAGTTKVGGYSNLDANEVQESQKSGKKGRVKKTAKSGGLKQVALGMDHGDGMISGSIGTHKNSRNEFTSEIVKEEVFLKRKITEGNTEQVSDADTGDVAVGMISNDKVPLLSVKDGTGRHEPDNEVKKVNKKHKRDLSSVQMEGQGCCSKDLLSSKDKKNEGKEMLHDNTEKADLGKKKPLLVIDGKTSLVNAVWTAAVRDRLLMSEKSENFSASSSTSKGTVPRKEKIVDQSKVTAKKQYGASKGKTMNSTNQKKTLLSISGNIFKDDNDETSADNDADSDASTRTPSDNSFSSDSEWEVNMGTPVGGSPIGTQAVKRKNGKKMNMSGLKDMDLDNVLRSSSRFKKAKLSASQLEETESQTVDIVPDSQAGL